MRTLIAVSLFVASLVLPFVARADEGQPSSTKASEKTPKKEKEKKEDDVLDLGLLGGAGFPRPLALEAVVGLHKTVMFGAEYSFLPTLTFNNVETRLWAAALDFRWFPLRGSFFVGLRGGYQELSVRTTLSAAGVGSYVESAEVGTWFLNPRIGFLWVWKPFALGLDAGIQIPMSTTVTRSSLLGVASPDLDSRITTASNMLGQTVIPTIDLLRIGVVF